MTMPSTYNFSLQRRADYSMDLQFLDSDGAPLNLTGWTVLSQAWNEARTQKYADFAVTYVDRVQGKIRLTLTDEQTATFPSEIHYDVLLIDPSGFREYYLEGVGYVSEGYTA